MAPIPPVRVQGHLHGGPHDGEVVPMPWALASVPRIRWEGEEMITTDYCLQGFWRGQVIAHYRPV
jgi:hypothetical protein